MELNKEDADLKEVAQKIGFENHLDMASYMKSKRFEWSQEAGNYISTAALVSKDDQIEQVVSNDGTFGAQQNPAAKSGDFNQFLPLLEWLASNKDGLQSLLGTTVAAGATGQIPRFTLPGIFVTKSVHMTNTLDQMVRDFSKEKNIN